MRIKLICLYTPKKPDYKKPVCYGIFIDKNGDYIEARIPLHFPIVKILKEQNYYEISNVDILDSDDKKYKGN